MPFFYCVFWLKVPILLAACSLKRVGPAGVSKFSRPSLPAADHLWIRCVFRDCKKQTRQENPQHKLLKHSRVEFYMKLHKKYMNT